MLTIGVDIGGTFTDFVIMDDTSRTITTRKVPSTPMDPSEAVLRGIEILQSEGVDLAETVSFLHGSTITTNALIQRRGARTGLLLTQGLKGVFQVQSQMTSGANYATNKDRPPALVDELDVFEIPERIDRDGKIVLALDVEAVNAVAKIVQQSGIESLAICLIFSFANDYHESLIKEIIRKEAPECHVYSSSEILPRVREWPRMSTTILDAYLEPVLVGYIEHLAAGLSAAGISTTKTFLMSSNGGVMPFQALSLGGKAVHTLLSGPAAAVQAAKRLAEIRGSTNLVTMDIGGTSCDVAFVRNGTALEVTAGSIAGYEVFVPMLDIATIGAGGGTIAVADEDGRLQVGPRSAGADPGPAAYGRGGTSATITDADLVLGYLDPNYFLGGRLPLDPSLARQAIESNIASPLGLSIEEGALAAVRINDVHMAEAVRSVAAKAGVSLAECSLVACGGAGPVHAAAIAEEIGISEVLVPNSPGVFAALGLLCTDIVADYVKTDIEFLRNLDDATIVSRFEQLDSRASREFAAQGFPPDQIAFHHEVDARYAGQGFEIRVEVKSLSDSDLSHRIAETFHERHQEIYGHASPNEGVEVVSYRVRAIIAMPQYEPKTLENEPVHERIERHVRQLIFDINSGPVSSLVVRRSDLRSQQQISGPAVIEQEDTTTIVPPLWEATTDSFGTLILNRAHDLDPADRGPGTEDNIR